MSLSIEVFLDESLRQERKNFSDIILRSAMVSKKVERSLRMGDIQTAELSLRQVIEAVSTLTESGERLAQQIRDFDLLEYIQNTFHTEFYEACKNEGVHLEGDFPRYEAFPFRVEVIPDQKFVLVNEKKVRSLRPSVLAKMVRKEKERLEKAPFNAPNFLRALLTCYDLLVAELRGKTGVTDEVSVPLKKTYATLAPLPRWQKDYPIRFFAFDLHRLLKAGQTEIDGRIMELGSVPPSLRRNAIRVVDEAGTERLYGRLQFRRK